MNESKDTKVCKHCQSEIPKKAKICPVCKKKQGLPKWAIVLIVILVLAAIGSASGGNSDNSETTTTSQSSSTNETQNSTPEVKEVETESEPEIEYTAVDVDTMMDDLQSNAMKAEDTYNDKYLEITGRLALIDSDGKYISVFSQSDEFAILGVQCFIKDEDAKAKVMDMSIGDTVTLKVHIKEVGEVMAYVADIIEIE
ncbi:MAG: OB-fold protein [Anaerobutyricum sp.]|jgi:RNA polymerase subunit RPABC4/transcription elongation factor Spt4|nr:MAG TPA: hypothetical protein [Caudoviricetes sp.]